MPNPKLYKNQKQWMKDCLHQTMHMERKEREQSIAQCLQMWRDREKKKKKELARNVAASWLNSARAIPTTKIEELPGAQIEKPIMQAVKALMEEHPVSSGWHHGFSKKFNGLEPCWAIIFNRGLSDRAKKAIKDSGLKIKARGEYSDVYLEGVKKEDLEQATKAFNKLAEKYESIG